MTCSTDGCENKISTTRRCVACGRHSAVPWSTHVWRCGCTAFNVRSKGERQAVEVTSILAVGAFAVAVPVGFVMLLTLGDGSSPSTPAPASQVGVENTNPGLGLSGDPDNAQGMGNMMAYGLDDAGEARDEANCSQKFDDYKYEGDVTDADYSSSIAACMSWILEGSR